ncbi:hypothetical protein [Desulfonatronum sp. SC1]|uniref:hypothetical protein n=1 Tax=Desulfonatronum sp. SC1 TaxID=2109626 RepID=UPI00130490B5|nr:hypothetical protein [Desulfonatronum sp. SC1]
MLRRRTLDATGEVVPYPDEKRPPSKDNRNNALVVVLSLEIRAIGTPIALQESRTTRYS